VQSLHKAAGGPGQSAVVLRRANGRAVTLWRGFSPADPSPHALLLAPWRRPASHSPRGGAFSCSAAPWPGGRGAFAKLLNTWPAVVANQDRSVWC